MAGTLLHLNSAVVRLVVVAMLSPHFALRPSGVEAVLFHDHGPAGRHVHFVAQTESPHSDRQHAAVHEREHVATDASPIDGFAADFHSEDCDASLFVLGEREAIRAASPQRSDSVAVPAAGHTVGTIAIDNAAVLDSFATLSHLLTAPIPRADRSIERILLAGHSLLI